MPIEVLFIHSAGLQSRGQGSAPFVQHLRRDLGEAYLLTSPKMPGPTKPSYARWKAELDRQFSGGRAPRILIGHSLGGSVLLKYLSECETKPRAAGLFIVAAPYWGSPGWDVDEFVLPDDFARQLPQGLEICLYQSRDDEVVDIDNLSRYEAALPDATVRRLDAAGHTFKDGLPELARDIRALS